MGKRSRIKRESRAVTGGVARRPSPPVSDFERRQLQDCCDFIMCQPVMRSLVGPDVDVSVAAMEGGGVMFTFLPAQR